MSLLQATPDFDSGTARVPTTPSVSVIVPVRDGGAAYEACLASLLDASPRAMEVIVVADGDVRDAQKAKQYAEVRTILLEECYGPARARNLGAKAASGDIVLFIDADVTVRPDIFARVAAAFAETPHLEAIFGSYDDAPSHESFVSQYRNLLHHYVHQNSSSEASTFWSGCGAMRRDVFLAHGGFDERFRRPSIEDIELGGRLHRAGHAIRLDRDLQVKHLKRWTLFGMIRCDLQDRAVPWTEEILRSRDFPKDLNLRLASRFSVIAVYLLVAATVLSPWWTPALWVAASLALIVFLLNAPLYDYLRRKRNVWFVAKSIPCHWLYYFYCGIGFLIGFLRHHLLRK